MLVRGHYTGDEVHRAASVWDPPHGYITQEATPLLFGVQAYGDAAFNGQQCWHQLLPEAVWLASQWKDMPGTKAMLNDLSLLIEVTRAKPHRMLWFQGL